MTLVAQISLTVGMAANTVAIWLLIKTNCSQSRRISLLELELYALKFLSTGLRKVRNDSRVQRMAEDTQME